MEDTYVRLINYRLHLFRYDGSERSREEKNTVSRLIEKEKKILGAKGGS